MSEASSGSGRGKAAGASDQQCVHCKKEVPAELNCKFCPYCGVPVQRSIPTQQESSPLCVKCNAKLFTPTTKICHKCTADQRSGDSQEISSPPGGQPQPVGGPSAGVPSTDTVHQHKVGVQQAMEAMEAHKKADSSPESGKDVPPLAPTDAYDWQKEGGDRPPHDHPPVLPPRPALAARFPRPHPPSQTQSGNDKTYLFPRVFGRPQPHDQPARSQLVTGHTGPTVMAALQREPLSSVAQGHDTPYDRSVSPQALDETTAPSQPPAQVLPTDKQQNGNLPASTKHQQEHVPTPPAKEADSRDSTSKGSPPAGPTPVGQGPGTGQQGHPGTSASSTTTTEQPMDTGSSLQTTVGLKDSAQPKDTDRKPTNTSFQHLDASLDNSQRDTSSPNKRKRSLSNEHEEDDSPIKQQKTDTPEPSDKDRYAQEHGRSVAGKGTGARDDTSQLSQDHPPQTPNQQSGGQTPNEQSGSQTPNQQSGGQTPNEQSGGQTPNQQSGGQTPNQQSDGQTPIQQSGGQTPNEQSGSQTPNQQSDGQTPNEQSGSQTPNQQSGGQTPNEQSGGQTPNQQSGSPRPSSNQPDDQSPGSLPQSDKNTGTGPDFQKLSYSDATRGGTQASSRWTRHYRGYERGPIEHRELRKRTREWDTDSKPGGTKQCKPNVLPSSSIDISDSDDEEYSLDMPSAEGGTMYLKQGSPDVLFPGTKGKKKEKGDNSQRSEQQRSSTSGASLPKEKDQPKGSQKKDNPDKQPKTRGGASKGDVTSHPKPSMELKGLKAATPTMVTFHVIVPMPFWEWDDKSCMHMRFGHKDLGNWKENCGEFKRNRDLGDGWWEMTCTLPIATEILKQPIPYKYVIYSPKMENANDCYEFLHCYSAYDPNRCLRIPAEKFPGCFYQYDTVAYPRKTKISKKWSELAVDMVKEKGRGIMNFFGIGSPSKPTPKVAEEEFKPLNLQKMCEICLHVYLNHYKELLCTGNFPVNFKVYHAVEEICHIFQCIRAQNIALQGSSLNTAIRRPSDILKVLEEWMASILDCLQNGSVETQVVSALCLAYCQRNTAVHCSKELAASILGMLSLNPDKNSPDYLYLCDVLPKEHRRSAAGIIKTLCTKLEPSGFENIIEHLSALPLYHFLMGYSEPFGRPEMDPEKIKWGDKEKEPGLERVKFKTNENRSGFVEEYYHRFEPLFALDPLLLRAFIYICPRKDLPLLFEKIPLYLSAAWLSHAVLDDRIITRFEPKEWIVWLDHLKKLTTKQTEEQIDHHTLFSGLDASVLLYRSLSIALRNSSQSYVDVLKASVSLVLFAASQLKRLCAGDDDEKYGKTVDEGFGAMGVSLWHWIVDGQVIGGSLFGGQVPTYMYLRHYGWKARKELELWQSLLTLECPEDPDVTDRWYQIVRAHIHKRVFAEGFSADLKIELVCLLESYENVHTILTDILMEAGTNAIDTICSRPGPNVAWHFEKLAETRSKRVGGLLGTMLKRKYPSLCPTTENVSVSLEELLQWNLWPHFIKLYGSESKLKEGLPQECQIACICALSKFHELCDQLQTSDVTMQELKVIHKNEEQVKRLCEADTSHQERKELSFTSFKEVLRMRLEEFNSFDRDRRHLSHLCGWIHPSVQGVSELKQETQRNFNEVKINMLCKRSGENIQVLCFPSAKTLIDCAEEFHCLTEKYKNDLFRTAWKETMDAALRGGKRLTLSDINPLVWQPAFERCAALLDQLFCHSISLADVDRHFKGYQHLESHLQSLFMGVNACRKTPKDGAWIKGVLHRMNAYWNLCQYRDAANAFLKLKETLKLDKGDFRDVEKLSNELSTSMRDQTLADVNDSLIETAKFLEGITSNPSKLKCLQEFASCQAVVQWLQDVTKDVGDLQNFVNVALATAAGGEDDLAHDQLSNLRAVGSGFGSLIYNLPKDAGYLNLFQRCESLWKALKNSPKLPKMLKDCNKALDWYKSVKETQGSVEVTSYGQMGNILTYGYYRVGFNVGQAFHDIHDMIQLKLVNTPKQLPKTSYNLNELRDLESKLVLITGSKAENRDRVDKYLDTLHSVCRIAEVLIDLQQAGNVQYSDWTMEFSCADNTVEPNTLGNLAKEMEDELHHWKIKVKETRADFYELNYYTTLQLSSLRKELGKLKDPKCVSGATVAPGVLALLQSISSDITARDVCDVVMNVTATLSEQHRVSGSEDHILPPHAQSLPMELGSNNIAGPSHHVSDSVESNQPTLKDSILASVDTQASTVLPAPQLTADSLSEKQKEVYARLCDFFAFHSKLVLMAIEQFGEDEYEIENWVKENADKFEFSEDGGEEETPTDDGESSDSESEPEMSTLPKRAPSDASSGAKVEDSTSPPRPAGPIATITKKQPITEYHPVVQELIKSGYTPTVGIEAVERCGSNVVKCLDYLMDNEGEGDLFQSSRREPLTLEPMEHPLQQRSKEGIVVYSDENAKKNYLSILELGNVLQELSSALPTSINEPRPFPKILKQGSPNLVVTSPENVLRTALALYMENESLPLPTIEEVLICNTSTTTEEVTLLWQRAIGDPGFRRIFCLLHAEKLSYKVSDVAIRSLTDLTQGKTDYRLVIICSNEDEEKSHIISKLHNDRRPFALVYDTSKFQQYLKTHFTPAYGQYGAEIMASSVDHENSRVRIVASTRSGMGKSLYVRRMADILRCHKEVGSVCVTIPVHGPVVNPDTVMEFLKDHMVDSNCTIFHFDISPNVLHEVDTILFCLLILRGLSDSHGNVWRCYPSQLYTIEVTLPEHQEQPRDTPEGRTLALLELLPSVECISPKQAVGMMDTGIEDNSKMGMDQTEFESAAYQRVYQYLRRHIGRLNLDRFSYIGNVEGDRNDCLDVILSSCGIPDPSWSEIRHFIKFLDLQLQSCEASVFCDEDLVGDVMAGLKGFVVKFMIRMSRDFATSSLQGEVARENQELEVGEDLEQYQIVMRRQWEQSSHPYIFFNQDRISITFVGFVVTRNGDLTDPRRGGVLEPGIMTPQLYTGLKQNQVNFEDNCLQWPKHVMISKLATVMGIEYPYDPDPSYVLTVDNLIKMMAIHMRFRCGIPVVIMGETGCGKTRLIRYMCDLTRAGIDRRNMLIMKVHGGITEKNITTFMETAEEEARENRKKNLDTILFFDEANTTDAIGLIKEIMCDRRMHGKPISEDIKLIAACNPYRKHTEDMIERLESAGLGFYVRATETQQKLGKIPLRQLVYRVLDLPPSMRPLVYDFGQLNTDTEKDYTRQIVSDHVKKHAGLKQQNPASIEMVARVLAWSQRYMRERKDECSFVSLRDVERAMIVFEYFFDKMDLFGPRMDEMAAREAPQDEEVSQSGLDNITRSIILAIGVCYHARLQDRDEYEHGVSAQLGFTDGAERFRDEIRWCQDVLLDHMQLGPNIAKNAALRENIFMMAICIELRIPLFLVGKPGSSKSLAKAIVASSMQGQASSSSLLKEFKQVHMFSYQCSQLSTPESVIEVFHTAKKFQKKEDTTKYVSVVVLDEVGLAEDSPNLPLKALHPLLEDGTEGADEEQQIIDREKRVAFIGISNWALDPAKMNRGVMVTRGDPDVEELLLSARGICSHKENDRVKDSLDPYFEHFAEAYKAICEKQKREFFGLRDFYSLIKMLYWMCEKSGMPPTWPQLQHAIQRNFSGLEADDFDPLKEFENRIHNREEPDLTTISPELHHIVSPDCSKLGMIKTSLRTKETTWHGENRYLLFLTENYAALEILRHYLSDVVHIGSSPSTEETLRPEEMEPFILFGSSFPKDKEYAQVCRNINKIKICMETGRTVILLNLENLYESLYDVLNQYYIYVGGSRYVDLGLQTHRVKCRVNDNFKLILIAEKNTVYDKFPIPLINRLEKHFVLTSSVLTEWKLEVLQELEEWVRQFSRVSSATSSKSFKECDAFIGYTKDTAAAVVFQATNQLEKLRGEDLLENSDEWERMVATGCLATIDPHRLIDEGEGTELWKQAVLQMSQYLLLQTASPDALIRLQHTPLADQLTDLLEMYDRQHHTSIDDFLNHNLIRNEGKAGLLLQVTTHSHLLSADELEQLGETLSLGESHISYFLLQEFDTELDFSNKVSPAFQREPGDAYTHLLIIQCDSGHTDGDLIACARHRIYDERANSRREDSTHVLFIIHLPQQAAASSFVGFQGDRWISTHIDDLRPPSEFTLTLHQARESSISDLFYSSSEPYRQVLPETAEETMSDVLPNDGEEPMEDISSLQEAEGMDIEDIMKDSFMQFEAEGEGDSEMKEDIPTAQVLPEAELDDSTSSLPSSIPTSQVLPVVPDEEPRAPMKFGYYRRLHGCIQAAASKLQDSTKNKGRSTERVAILLDLIPKDSSPSIDNSSFYGILVSHIHKLLEERVEIRQDEKEWVLNEALNAVKLQNGGTFRNVLARKLDGVIIPIFAGIIGFIDRNYNLNLIRDKADKPATFHFWLDMFRDPQIMQFRYDEMAAREQVPGAGGRMSEEDFKCHLPFSWLIKETFDAQWDNAKSIADNNKQRLCAQLCEMVADSPVCRVLEGIDENDCEVFYKNYLYDFVRSVHKCSHKQAKYADSEYKLIVDALNSMVHAPEFSSIDGHESLTGRIAAVHVVHHFTKSETLWFGQLASHMPGILEPLQKNVPTDSSEMVLHLYAVEKALTSLDPPLEKEVAVLKQWLNNLRLSQNAIDSTLSLPSQNELHKTASRHWQLIRALQIFVEHVLMKYDGMVPLTRRLHMYLKDDPDFKKASTIERVKKHLNVMDKQTKRTHKDKLKSIRKSCRTFFMELVSTLCFRGQSAPDPDLIKMLIDTVFTEKQEELGTKDFTPYKETTSDTVPVIRSFLLQLLLEHNPEDVMVHLNDYFTRSCQVAHGDKAVDPNLQLLCVKCFEDALYKEGSFKSFNEQILEASSLLYKGHVALLQHAGFSQETIPLEYLYGVAQVRFAILVVADLFNKQVSESALRDTHGANANHLLQVARDVCTHPELNRFDITGSGNTTGPAVYLLKLLVRQYGTHCLQKLANSQHHSWIIPQELQSSGEEQQSKDPFVIYQAPYCHLRECMSTAAYGKDLKDLIEASQDLEAKDAPLLLLALYQTATLSRGSTLPSKQLLPDVLGELDTFIKTCKVLSQELQWTARALLCNEQGGILAQLAVAPRQPLLHRTLGAIVVHAAAVFFSRQRVEILKPFANMMNNPAALVNAYLPTMPEDDLPEVQRVLAGGGAFYECPRGHAYFVGECGRPVEENRCPVCHEAIGGVQHRLRHDNRNARRDDQTQAGYCLGPADGRGTAPSPERSLSSSASCILRALMHSALIWTSCNNTNAEGDHASLVKLGIRGRDLPEFFWNHLMKDLELLGRATGKSMDEAAVLMHLIIREILVQEPPRSDVVNTVSSLGARNARAEWEKIFNQTYMQPVLERLEERVGNAMTTILQDDKQEQDQLFYVVYERVKVADGSMEPHLWTYRSRITLEHLSQTLQQRNMKEKYPILHEFLQKEHNLRATQYLPSIVKLQQLLYDRFHHRLDRKEAKSVTIRQFLKDYIKTENVRNEYQEMIESFQRAWRLVGDQLKDHARLRVEKQYLCPVITDDTPLEYLIPSTTGAGACSTALVDFLLLTHNSFIERCRGIVTQREKSKSLWEEHKVPITHIHQCHLLDYEQQLLPIVLSHCRYSLTVGRGQKIDYDHPALEKHILDRFIHGKPLILSDIPQVVYRKDVYTAATFAAVRKKVDPQEPLPHRVQQEILLELRSVDRLRETLDVVDIVLGFLSSGGGSANKLLGGYIKNTLKMRRPFCEKAREYCNLGHIISLWETLSVELARQLTLSGQEPFDMMREEFLEELKKDQQDVLTTHLRSFDLDQLLGTLYEFIETYIKYSPNNEKDWPLVVTLDVVLERNGLPPIPHLEQFPDTITLAQSVATWKYIVNYQEKHRHEG